MMPEAFESVARGYETLPIPFGWFAVAISDEISVGDVKTMRYFGTEFVLWRGEDGAVHAVDPYCPHLGAHLGFGGEVVGNDLRCPFHHWSFNGGGGVTDIPYTRAIAPKLERDGCLPTWPVQEDRGVIYAWYHPKKAAPKWEVAGMPALPEGIEGDWVESERHEWVINIHCQEITENGQDYAHFLAVHGTQGPPETEFRIDGWVRRSSVETQMTTPRGPMTGLIAATATGPGQSITLFADITHIIMSQQVTPIDAHTTHLRWQLYHLPDISDGKMRVTKARMRDLVKQVNQDIPIWNAKRYLTDPLLVQGDGPILAYRRQYQRFYQFDEPEQPSIAA
jgi:3-ketosteroid 9alpha-monooxygenase subunit A